MAAASAIGVCATAAWVAFAFEPGTGLAIAATGLVACLVAAVAPGHQPRPRRALARSTARSSARRRSSTEVVQRGAPWRATELERTLARARADSLSAFAEEERRLAEETRRQALGERAAAAARARRRLLEGREPGRAAARCLAPGSGPRTAALGERLEQIAERERSLIEALESRLNTDADRLKTADEEQRAALARLREDLGRAAAEAAAKRVGGAGGACDGATSCPAPGRRAADRPRAGSPPQGRARGDRRLAADSEHVRRGRAAAGRAARARARPRGSAGSSTLPHISSRGRSRRARGAARRLQRELERAVQSFAREGESLLAERLAQLGDAGGMRLEKKLEQVAAGLERQARGVRRRALAAAR